MFGGQLSENLMAKMDSEAAVDMANTGGATERRAFSRSPSKARSLSDGGPPALSPSPKFREPDKKKSKDDSALGDGPSTPRRPAFAVRGLSLQMPAGDIQLMSPNTWISCQCAA